MSKSDNIYKIHKNISGVILSGGKNSRMGGMTKSFIPVAGMPIISRILNLFEIIFDDIVIVTNSTGEYKNYSNNCTIVSDLIENSGPLGGIHSGLVAARQEAVFFVASDMPFLHNTLIDLLINKYISIKCDAVIPRIGKNIEPLHAVYSKGLAGNIEHFLKNQSKRSVQSFLKTINVCYLDLNKDDCLNKSFININTPQDIIKFASCDVKIKMKSKVWIEKNDKLIFGSGKAALLGCIQDTGSINKAAKKMNMSYRRAWSYIHAVETNLNKQLLIKVKGGKTGGGATLTPFARKLLSKFNKLEFEITAYADKQFEEIFKDDGII